MPRFVSGAAKHGRPLQTPRDKGGAPVAAYAGERARMVRQQLADRGIRDQRVLDALASVPRHAFVSRELTPFAYDDAPLPIGDGQTISQPYIVAFTVEALRLTERDRVLDVGTGSGYAAAVLSQVAREVFSI